MENYPIILKVKPVSTNRIHVGRRWKSKEAVKFEQDVALLLFARCPQKNLPDGDLHLKLQFGITRRMDVSNCAKLFEDCLARHFGIDDRRFAALTLVRSPVKAGQEFIKFAIEAFDKNAFDFG